MNESTNFDESFENLSNSVISGIKGEILAFSMICSTWTFHAHCSILSLSLFEESISPLSDDVSNETKAKTHENHHHDDDVATSVTSPEAAKMALTLPVPDSLQSLNRNKLER